ncbi:geranylgeranylglycerol-phosphate geranylgeranyltransferase [uncultured Fibrobacter sp.]|uniref:geranylgeranylglycerol-phosphate geranylgeranyltransferase n=1 Tax=uncultured Fibrobacter sp. TaxID=261512 RepID=UPI0025E51825|nr:geranylgeranylglycerol-phosphate geranylgeranyltransferase [uncultured Fibrobacter sp.]
MLAALFKMTRPKNIVIAVITLIVGYALLKNFPSIPSLVLQSLGFAFAIGFANIQNDILDLESDKMNRPERPLVTGKVSVKAARRTWITMFILMLLCGGGDSLIQAFSDNGLFFWKRSTAICHLSFPLWFFLILGLLLIAYNKWLKHIPLLKNMTVAFLCTTPLLFAAQHFVQFNTSCVHTEFLWAIIPAIPFAFLLTTAREIYKDLEDETGDLKAGIMTFPLIAGSETARRFAGAIITFTWISLPIPVYCINKLFKFSYPPLFLIITGITLTPCFAYVLVQAHRKNYRRAQSAVKIGMFLGLIALIVSC